MVDLPVREHPQRREYLILAEARRSTEIFQLA